MVKKEKWLMISLCAVSAVLLNSAPYQNYGEKLCTEDVNYFCYKVKKGETWNSLWTDPETRIEAQKINRQNTPLKTGQLLAIPNFPVKFFNEYCPFEQQIEKISKKVIVWDPNLLAWAAYNLDGDLVRWGPGAGGKEYCHDVGRSCRTTEGEFKVIFIGGPYYRSSKYPRGCQGTRCALMAYPVFFKPQYAFHAGKLPGTQASHGCIRLFNDDANWLNEYFADKETIVIILPY